MHGSLAALALYYYRCASAHGQNLGIKEDNAAEETWEQWNKLIEHQIYPQCMLYVFPCLHSSGLGGMG